MSPTPKSENWYIVYREIAALLHQLYKRTKGDPGRHLYKKCINSIDFRENNSWIEKFRSVYKVTSLDPIHIFSSFNGNNLTSEKRKDRINIVFRLLESNKVFESIDFTGCPTPFIIQMIGARNEKMQIQVWQSFVDLFSKRQNGLTKEVFQSAVKWYGIDTSAFTIFLFWIDSSNFLPLDKNTIEFLRTTGKIYKKPRSYESYIELLTRKNTSLYREIAKIGYDIVEKGVKIKKYPRQLSSYISKQKLLSADKGLFKVVAVKLLPRISRKFKKVLSVGPLYQFYSSFEFITEDIIKYDRTVQVDLYKIFDLNIEISAIVGKNGSGKSTITELLYLAINNLAAKSSLEESKNLQLQTELYMDLYFLTDSLYRIKFLGSQIQIKKYVLKNDRYQFPKAVSIQDFPLENFFYSIVINYSHFSLNSNHVGTWIDKLFHKNDGYQVPIVINPYRNKGNIDINLEEGLAKSRLLYNILLPILEQEQNSVENSLRMLTVSKYADKLTFKINKTKFDYIYESDDGEILHFEELLAYQETILDKVNDEFGLKIRSFSKINPRRSIYDYAKLYIVKKIVTIAIKYAPYKDYFDFPSRTFSELDDYIENLAGDNSHITFKLRQAINVFKYPLLKGKSAKFTIEVEKLADQISGIMTKSEDEELQRIHLIPPSFFDVQITLSDGKKSSDFQDLSSGEKQRIYTVNSLVYHLFNLNSVSTNNDFIAYDYINIVFDEIELYFHPDMQRTFISYILWYLKRVPVNNIKGLNFCFVTHSPFILSDIPVENILFLGEEEKSSLRTFGANIHELLVDGFFMKQTLGDYALEQVNDILNFYKEVENASEFKELKKFKEEYQARSKKFSFIVNSLGEEYIKRTLINHILAIEDKLQEKNFMNLYREKLLQELRKIDNHAKDQLPIG